MGFDFRKKGFVEAVTITVTLTAVLIFITWQMASAPVLPQVSHLQKEVSFLSDELTAVKGRLDRVQARNAVLERETKVLRGANQLLREQESSRQAEINQLQSELDFFRRLAGTGGRQSGLDVYHMELVPTDSQRVYQFILTLTQNIRRASIISGKARIDLEGTMEDRPVTLYWSRLSGNEIPEPSFRFKYFQQLEGYLTLPEGFSPVQLRITLDAGDRQKPVQKSYDWDLLLNPPGPEQP
jgi:hypothetical protein